jgi:hypothetical protein
LELLLLVKFETREERDVVEESEEEREDKKDDDDDDEEEEEEPEPIGIEVKNLRLKAAEDLDNEELRFDSDSNDERDGVEVEPFRVVEDVKAVGRPKREAEKCNCCWEGRSLLDREESGFRGLKEERLKADES